MKKIGIISDTHAWWDDRYAQHFADCDEVWHAGDIGSDDLADRDFTRLRTHVSYSLKGEKKIHTYMTWTLSGLRYLNSKLGYPNF